ncbi:MAG: polyketide cyclase [Verrucomicrobiales bacterium]|nr:polyketide cyclase [Verrucomicrobiales bacterium]
MSSPFLFVRRSNETQTKMLLNIVIAVVVLIAVFLVIVAMRPADFRVTRNATISAPPAAIFAHVNDLHNWENWSPWAKLDPAVKNSFEGPASGTGSIFSWSGNNQVGEGRMTIIESRPYELVKIKLDFFKPFAASNTAEFTFKPEGNQTLVTWSMYGKNGFMSKAVGLFMNCEKMLGGFFEKGLAQLASVSEASIKK